MEREEALARLRQLVGRDLHELAEMHGVTIKRDGRTNKGWAGHTIERCLGLPLNSAQAPNFGSWELKTASLKRLKTGLIKAKETLAVTMFDPVHVAANPFESSHLYTKFRKMLVCARLWNEKDAPPSLVVDVAEFDLTDVDMLEQVRADYEMARALVRAGKTVHSEMGKLVQVRTKGPANSSSRAFYARSQFVDLLFDLPREWEP